MNHLAFIISILETTALFIVKLNGMSHYLCLLTVNFLFMSNVMNLVLCQGRLIPSSIESLDFLF